MARTSNPHSADSQFYVNLADNTPLDPRPTRWGYTVFGRVTDGMHVIDEIGYQATGSGPNAVLGRDVPAEQVVILSAKRIATAPVTPKAETEK
jgi:cyclophilin family peptidyl-prolyl cis-trans isomerase